MIKKKLTGTPPAMEMEALYVSYEGSNSITSSPGSITVQAKTGLTMVASIKADSFAGTTQLG